MNARTVSGILALLACLSAAQCLQQQRIPAARDSAQVARLERDARAIAKADGCSSLDHCRSAPVGERPCGGPRDYIVYCARTTDTAALHRKLAELRQAEMELNRKTGAMSTCEFRMPPEVAITGGSCRSK